MSFSHPNLKMKFRLSPGMIKTKKANIKLRFMRISTDENTMTNTCFQSITIPLLLCLCLSLSQATAGDPNVLTAEEKTAGFVLIFNGQDLQGWQQSGNWMVEDGSIFRARDGGDLIYPARRIPDDFELRFQWKVAEGSNSGVYYRPGQYEYQILDNKGHTDGKNPRSSAASLYFCMAPSYDATKPVGQWNTGRIIGKGTVIQHWLNGVKVIGFDYSDPKWAWNVDLLRKRGADVAARGAFLKLQDHRDPIWYRGIKLRSLDRQDKLDRTPVVPAEIPEAVLKAEQKKLEAAIKYQQEQEPAK